jgi:putative ABC transport system substrate-binding protein
MHAKMKVGREKAEDIFFTFVLVLVSLMAATGTVLAQQADRVYRVVSLLPGRPGWVVPPPEKWTGPPGAYRDFLRDKGFVVGKNLVLEVRHADGDASRLPTVATSVVASKPDAIVTSATAATVAAMQATKTIPILLAGVGAPVEKGFVASLARPGGNVTGTAGSIGNPKLWQLLRDVAPTTRRAGLLMYGPNMQTPMNASYLPEALARLSIQAAAVDIEAIDLTVNTQEELEPKLAELARRGDATLYLLADPVLFQWRTSILEIASRYRLPTVCSYWEWGAAGCLASYSEDPYEMFKSLAGQIDKILRGIKPADIPVEQATKFKLIINAKSAKAIGLSVPSALLVAADEVIE